MDVIGDFLTIIRNGIAVSKLSVLIPYSKLKNSILLILKDEGFIRDFNIEGDGVKKNLRVFLKYVDGESTLKTKLLSFCCKLRMYWRLKPVGFEELYWTADVILLGFISI